MRQVLKSHFYATGNRFQMGKPKSTEIHLGALVLMQTGEILSLTKVVTGVAEKWSDSGYTWKVEKTVMYVVYKRKKKKDVFKVLGVNSWKH